MDSDGNALLSMDMDASKASGDGGADDADAAEWPSPSPTSPSPESRSSSMASSDVSRSAEILGLRNIEGERGASSDMVGVAFASYNLSRAAGRRLGIFSMVGGAIRRLRSGVRINW